MSAREIDNRDGQIITASGSSISAHVGKLDNRSGIVSSGADATLTVAGAIDNSSGEIQAAHALRLGRGRCGHQHRRAWSRRPAQAARCT
ncbi:hypothetical protein [Massilia eburnea]|uniref:hypothetical protein n=1 Tax=Massilia eburnea TaxID=1776165 RepID=UPI003D6BCC40